MQERHEIKLLALDIDGTLITSDHCISAKTQEAIKRSMDHGVHVMLSTGRPPGMCQEFIDLLKLDSFLITASGAEIWSNKGEILERHAHDATLIEALYNKGQEIGLHMWLISSTEVFENGAYPADFQAYDWLKIGFFTDEQSKLEEMYRYLERYDTIEITNSHPSNIEVNPAGVSKADALRTVCKELNITMDEVMAIGDSLNDLTMVEQAGIGVAMGNAQEKLKEVADYITYTNDEDGIAKVIEKFIL